MSGKGSSPPAGARIEPSPAAVYERALALLARHFVGEGFDPGRAEKMVAFLEGDLHTVLTNAQAPGVVVFELDLGARVVRKHRFTSLEEAQRWIAAQETASRAAGPREGAAGRGAARQGEARQGAVWPGVARRGVARRGVARQGQAGRGPARRSKARHDARYAPPAPASGEPPAGGRVFGGIDFRGVIRAARLSLAAEKEG